jgi:transketolase
MDKKIIQKNILTASFEAKACHLGSALSCVDILVDLFDNVIQPNDVFLFSKASGVATYYAILADRGYFAPDKLAEYIHKYPLPSKEVPGVLHSFGSLGHGLSVAAGLALADRKRKVYVLLSDGECQEGSTMEAVLFARQHRLDNLYVHIDYNKLQACGAIDDVLKVDWNFFEYNLPHCKIHHTIKGAGIDFMEGDYNWHYQNLTPELLDEALKQI